MTSYTILSTKKIKPALKTALEEKGIACIEQEFISIQPIRNQEKQEEVLRWIETPEATAIVFTSRHAVITVALHLHHDDTWNIPAQWRIYCLGGATKEEVAKHFKPEQITATASDATALANTIINQGAYPEVVFFCGNQRRNELPDLLRNNGITVHEVVVYETTETPQQLTGKLDAVLFFSPSAVKSFFAVNTLPPETTGFAIGPTTAATLKQFTGNRIITSEQPDQETMIARVWRYLQNTDQ